MNVEKIASIILIILIVINIVFYPITYAEEVIETEDVQTNYQIKDVEEWDVSSSNNGSVMARWTFSDRTIRIYGNGNASNIDKVKIYNELVETLIVEEGVTNLAWLKDAKKLKKVVIPASVTTISYVPFLHYGSLENIEVDKNNQYFEVIDGVLYTKDLSTLIKYPAKKTGKTYMINNNTTQIGKNAFENCIYLENITIPEGVTELVESAFYGCSSLKNITIPNSVSEIGYACFENCSELETIVMSDNIEKIYTSTFRNCKKLKNINLPNGITSITRNIFENCESLENIEIPNGVTVIETKAFSGCKKLNNVILPNGLLKIEYGAFMNCSSMKNIVIPESVTTIGTKAFTNSGIEPRCKTNSLLNEYFENEKMGYYLTDNVTPTISTNYQVVDGEEIDISFSKDRSVIATWSASNCTLRISGDGWMASGNTTTNNLEKYEKLAENIIIEEGITEISYSRFAGFRNLRNIELPNSLEKISDFAFSTCTSIENITIPVNVTSLGKNAFYGCSSLKSVNILGNISEIKEETFNECVALENINIPNSVTSIGQSAFSACVSIKNITIPNSVLEIGDYAFSYCNSLEYVYIPESVTKIGVGVFNNYIKTKLKSIEVNENNPNYKSVDGVLYTKNLSRLIKYPADKEGITYSIGSNVTIIENYAFSGCENLKNIIVPKKVSTIKESAFYNCNNLTIQIVNNEINLTGYYIFSFCKLVLCEKNSNTHKYLESSKNIYRLIDSSENDKLKGDINNNSRIDVGDILLLQRHIAVINDNRRANEHPGWMLTNEKIIRGDLNSTGKIDIGDILIIQRYIAASSDSRIANLHPKWLNI